MPVHSISPKLLLSALPGGSHRTRRLGHNQPETTRQLSVRLFDSSPRSQSDTLPDKSQVDIRSTNPYSGLWPCWTTRCMRCTWLKTYLSRFTYRLAILQYTKIRLLQLTYGCLDVYATCMASQLLESDTDCFVREFYTLEVCPDLKQQFSYAIWNNTKGDAMVPWFPRICCLKHAAYDRRTPGRFKMEASGDEMICLSSKTYQLQDADKLKMFRKGVNKSRIVDPVSIFKRTLFKKERMQYPPMSNPKPDSATCTLNTWLNLAV